MKTLRFGIEIETVGQTRARVAEAIRSVVGGTARHTGTPSCYDPYEVTAADGRTWKVMAIFKCAVRLAGFRTRAFRYRIAAWARSSVFLSRSQSPWYSDPMK